MSNPTVSTNPAASRHHPMPTPQTTPPRDPIALLHHLETTHAQPAPRPHGWHGFTFTLAQTNLIIPRSDGIAALPPRPAHPLPGCHRWVCGVIHVSGEIHTLIDLPAYLGNRPAPATAPVLLLSPPATRGAIRSALRLPGQITLRHFPADTPPATTPFPPNLTPYLTKTLTIDHQPYGVLDIAALTNTNRFLQISHTR